MGLHQPSGVDALPDMAMAVDHAGHQDLAPGLDDLGAFPLQGLTDRRDLAVLDEHVGLETFPELRVHSQEIGAANDRRAAWSGRHGLVSKVCHLGPSTDRARRGCDADPAADAARPETSDVLEPAARLIPNRTVAGCARRPARQPYKGCSN